MSFFDLNIIFSLALSELIICSAMVMENSKENIKRNKVDEKIGSKKINHRFIKANKLFLIYCHFQ